MGLAFIVLYAPPSALGPHSGSRVVPGGCRGVCNPGPQRDLPQPTLPTQSSLETARLQTTPPMHWPTGTRRSEALAQWCPDCICRRYKLRQRSGHAGCAGEHGAGPHVLKYGTGSPSHSSQTVPQTQVKARACKARTRHGKCAHVQGVTAAWRTAAGWGPRSKPDLRTKPPWHQRQGPNTEESRGSSLRASDLPGRLSTW